MPRAFTPEEIVAKLREIDVLVSQRQPMADATSAETPPTTSMPGIWPCRIGRAW